MLALLALSLGAHGAYDMGPTFGEDRVGGDYAHLLMHSPPSLAPNHWAAAAAACAQHCAADAKCCEYTYVPPDRNTNSGGDTCILKTPVSAPSRRQPPSGDTRHWTGLAPRAVTDATNNTLSAQCRGRPAPVPAPHHTPGPTPTPAPCAWPSSCKGLWDNVHCVCNPTWEFPGPAWLHPKIHNSPDCLHNPGWHDMAGAITFGGVQHIFQGCPDGPGSDSWNNHPDNHDTAGWHHATSTDYVHFKNLGIPPGLAAIKETYKGMDSDETPCSGFVTIDPENHVACAGFRQCHGNGVKGKSKDGVPLELRCTPIGDSSLQNWSAPEFIDAINPSWPHHEPYDPVRPWVDADGLWYVALSLDACDNTQPICPAGGSLLMYRSPALRGSKANWTRHGELFTTNTTKSGANTTVGGINSVFVTSDYIGGLRGDPAGGKTRCVLQNTGGSTYWCGAQRNGNALQPHWDKVGAVGKYDYGACTMARTVGPNANQVLPADSRIVLMGWTSSPEDGIWAASQSLARDLTMSSEYELLQQFVPELQMLRLPGSQHRLSLDDTKVTEGRWQHVQGAGALRLEILARFSWSGGTGLPTKRFGFSFLGGAGNVSIDCTNSSATGEAPGGCMVGIVGSTNNTGTTVTWMPVLPIASSEVWIHTIVDHSIVETIVNNRTAMITNSINTKSAADTGVALFGAAVHGQLTTYQLKAANNLNGSASYDMHG